MTITYATKTVRLALLEAGCDCELIKRGNRYYYIHRSGASLWLPAKKITDQSVERFVEIAREWLDELLAKLSK